MILSAMTLALLARQDPPVAPEPNTVLMERAMAVAFAEGQVQTLTVAYGLRFGEGEQAVSVYVSKTSEPLLTGQYHAIYTEFWKSAEPPSAELLAEASSDAKKFGHVYLVRFEESGWSLRFGTQFDATEFGSAPRAQDGSIARFRTAVSFVAAVGNEMRGKYASRK